MAQTNLSPGVWGVLATPFQGSALNICETSLIREVEQYVRADASGITVLGVFGEAARLSLAEQRDVAEIVRDVRGEFPVVVGLSGLATRVVIEQALNIKEHGGDIAGFMIQINSGNANLVGKHLRAFHDETGVGIVLQDYPLVSGVRMEISELKKVVADHEDIIVAVKSESPPTPPAIISLVAATSIPIFGGLGGVNLVDEMFAGAAGAMTGFSFPEALVATVRAYQTGGYEAARAEFAPWLPLVNFESQVGISLAVRKECLQMRGFIMDSAVRPPAPSMPESLTPLLKKHIAAANLLLRS